MYLFSLFPHPPPPPPMPPASLLLFFTLCGLAVSVSTREVNLHHRVFVPSVSDNGHPAILPPWVPRGTAEILSSSLAKYSPVSNPNDEDLVVYRSVAGATALALYQVALEVPGVPPNLWPFSSVKTVCIPNTFLSCSSIFFGGTTSQLF